MPQKEKRKYTQKNEAYWSSVKGVKKSLPSSNDSPASAPAEAWSPTGFSMSTASEIRGNSSGPINARGNKVATKPSEVEPLKHLESLPLPYFTRNGMVSMKDAIQLCQRVYANIAIFRNTIDIMTEFSAADIYLTGGNEASKTFVNNWLKKINAARFSEYFFREYYRSGNVFIYRFDGKFSDEDFKKLKTSYAAKKNFLPIRYTILNPADIVIFSAASFENAPFRKCLNEYELQALREQKTPEDKQLFDALPADIKEKISKGRWGADGIWIPIEGDRLTAIFYKKQPYEPFAIPFGYPVLKDLNHKEELKKIDQAIARTIDNVILLVTMGAPKDQFGNGMNPKAMEKMQELLRSESVGRALVSDHTTKAEFVIPDIGEILNPAKYQIVNEDIKQGLLNIISGEDKFANAVMKAQIFIERLEEGRAAFIDGFLQNEIRAVCKANGFRAIPKANFQSKDLKDDLQYARVYTRLVEIGVLTPEQGLKAIQTGVFPEEQEMKAAQETYTEERKNGLYNPLVGGVPMAVAPEADKNRDFMAKQAKEAAKNAPAPVAAPAGKKPAVSKTPNSSKTGRPAGTKAPQSTKKVTPIGRSKAEVFSVTGLRKVNSEVSDLLNTTEALVKEKHSLASLSDAQQDLVFKMVTNVIASKPMEEWKLSAAELVENPDALLTYQNLEHLDEISEEHQVDTYSAAILLHSQWVQ